MRRMRACVWRALGANSESGHHISSGLIRSFQANSSKVLVEPLVVAVEDGRVASIGAAPPGTATRDCSGCLVIPGNVCAHHHLYSSLARGMPYRLDPPRNFVETLRRLWWRLDRALDDEAVWASAVVGGAVAILNGTTTVIDHHASPNAVDGSLDLIASVQTDLGVRSVLCYEVSDRDGPERADAGLEENRRFLKSEWPLSKQRPSTAGSRRSTSRSISRGVSTYVPPW